MEPFVTNLLRLYKQKLSIFRSIKNAVGTRMRPGPVEEILRSPASAYKDEERVVISRLTAALDALEAANIKLKRIEITRATSDINIISSYRKMMEFVDQEHSILVEFLNSATKEILERKDVEQWIEHLQHIERFINVLRKDVRLFNSLLKEIVKRGHLRELREIAGERLQRQTTFFHDLFRELRNPQVLARKLYSESSVERLIQFAHDNRVINENQAEACELLSIPIIRRYSGDLARAEGYLSHPTTIRCFEPLKPHLDVIQGFRYIIEELRQGAQATRSTIARDASTL